MAAEENEETIYVNVGGVDAIKGLSGWALRVEGKLEYLINANRAVARNPALADFPKAATERGFTTRSELPRRTSKRVQPVRRESSKFRRRSSGSATLQAELAQASATGGIQSSEVFATRNVEAGPTSCIWNETHLVRFALIGK